MKKKIRNEQGRSGVWSALAYFAGVAALVVAVSFLTAQPAETEPEPLAVAETTTTSTSTPVVDVEAPTYVLGEEPIADAAEVILPSVVHIQTPQGLGSGVVYTSNGLIITAAHVVEDQEVVTVRFDNGDQMEAEVVGLASDVDVAVLRVDREDLVPAVFNTDKPRVGQLAVAVGSPWGLESTVTAGIISAVDQANCDFGACFSQVQTDAAINPGNSGGALVDRHGQVVGINVSIRTESGANDGVGFAVPSETVLEYAESIIAGTPLETAFLGVTGSPAVGDRAGAAIQEVRPNTAAEEAGLQVGDIIISVAGVEVNGSNDLAAQIRTHRPGDVVELTLIRDGEEMTIEVELGVRPPST